ncbi:unnamed protein product [Protopolystoma xenopodis]|uniref:Uncharacterized protein n=1 Tax=Protopolystoma xenopodis TaxID=117903 RepID=A0A448XPC4_9PLAT|nr:unnamed protein product [Protopolystoma xenopodis]
MNNLPFTVYLSYLSDLLSKVIASGTDVSGNTSNLVDGTFGFDASGSGLLPGSSAEETRILAKRLLSFTKALTLLNSLHEDMQSAIRKLACPLPLAPEPHRGNHLLPYEHLGITCLAELVTHTNQPSAGINRLLAKCMACMAIFLDKARLRNSLSANGSAEEQKSSDKEPAVQSELGRAFHRNAESGHIATRLVDRLTSTGSAFASAATSATYATLGAGVRVVGTVTNKLFWIRSRFQGRGAFSPCEFSSNASNRHSELFLKPLFRTLWIDPAYHPSPNPSPSSIP